MLEVRLPLVRCLRWKQKTNCFSHFGERHGPCLTHIYMGILLMAWICLSVACCLGLLVVASRPIPRFEPERLLEQTSTPHHEIAQAVPVPHEEVSAVAAQMWPKPAHASRDVDRVPALAEVE
jgi:hypothetical protein